MSVVEVLFHPPLLQVSIAMMTSVRKGWRPDLAVDALFPWRGGRVPAVGRRRALAARGVDATHPQPVEMEAMVK